MAKGSSSGNSSPSKSLMWMMIAVFFGLAGLLGAALFVASRTFRSMGLSAVSSQAGIRTPNGTFRVEQQTEVGPGMPISPRSSLIVPDDRAAVAAAQQAQAGIETSTYHTSDTRDFVDGWYSKHLSPQFTRHEAGDKTASAIYSDVHISEDDIAFVAEREKIVRIVSLSLDSGGTKILLIRFSKSSSGMAPAGSSSPASGADSAPVAAQ
jgi:hypothetical protein